MLTRRLYLQIYLTILGSLVLVVVLTALLWNATGGERMNREAMHIGGRLAWLALPSAVAPRPAQGAAVDRLGRELGVDVTLYGGDGRLIAANGRPAPPPGPEAMHEGWHRVHDSRFWALGLPDGRVLVANLGRRGPRPLLGLALLLGSVALGVGLGAYPLVRRLTRRLERLQEGVERIGAGDLAARVEIEGRDEIAGLAASFNEAAGKIEELVGAHRMLLANASHELRTPLARIRLGAEMLRGRDDPARWAALREDIAELDQLIDEILLMSRLEAGAPADLSQPVDLVALAAEECARYDDCEVEGAAPEIAGDLKLLRRLLRNLLENAHQHGAPPIRVTLAKVAEGVELTVSDGGQGIPEAERGKVFRPFYRAPGRQNVEGYGLGLALVCQIAALHGGSAAVLSRNKAGSAIRVSLPVRRAEGRH